MLYRDGVYERTSSLFFRCSSNPDFFLFRIPCTLLSSTRAIRHARHSRYRASHYIDPLPFRLIGGFPGGAFDDRPSTHIPSGRTSAEAVARGVTGHAPSTYPVPDVTDSASVKKANTKPISAHFPHLCSLPSIVGCCVCIVIVHVSHSHSSH